MPRRILQGKRIIVTGASSGIGLSLVHQLASRGARLVLMARNAEALDRVTLELSRRDVQAVSAAGDVSMPEARVQAVELCTRAWGGVDGAVLCAGIGASAPFERHTTEEFRRIMEVNFFANVDFIQQLLPLLRMGEQPFITLVGSIVGHVAIPYRTAYCASKFALHGFASSLRHELAGQGVDLLEVDPGRTDTPFDSRQVRRETQFAPSFRGTTAEVVARRTVRAIEQRRSHLVPSLSGRALLLANRIAPSLVDWFVGRIRR